MQQTLKKVINFREDGIKCRLQMGFKMQTGFKLSHCLKIVQKMCST